MTKLLSQDTAATFKELSYFNESTKFGYQLLPFRFIKLDSSRYVLTNIAGEYIVLSRDLLTSFIEKKLTPDLEIYNSLKTKHFLLDNDSNVAIELLATKYRTKLVPISNFTSLHMFVVTLRCDHSCPYCQVSRQSEDRLAYDMSEDTAMKALDFTFRSPSPSIKIEFQGGESLLNFELVKFIVFEAIKRNEKEKRNIQFVIATNLSQINDDILQFCLKFKVLISTALLGNE
jgi:sulfatase maturation enzyme AslB (radical SAM superfamily)